MKYIFPILGITIVLAFLFLKQKQNLPLTLISSTSPTPAISDTSKQLLLNNQNYRYYYYQIPKNSQLKLIPNFSSLNSSSQIIKNNSCDFAINGGLYTTESKPVGLFYLDNQSLGQQINHQTFDGFLTQDKNNNLNISSQDNFNNDLSQYNFALQSGPFYDLQSSAVDFINQEYDRRHLIAKDIDNNFYFFSISLKENAFSGPRLQDIYGFFQNSEIQKIAKFTFALNLDGGTASAFYNGHYLVQELTPVGSLLCGTLNP